MNAFWIKNHNYRHEFHISSFLADFRRQFDWIMGKKKAETPERIKWNEKVVRTWCLQITWNSISHHWVGMYGHSDNDCILITIILHGDLCYIHANYVQHEEDSLWQHFTTNHCPKLASKQNYIHPLQEDGGVLLTKDTLNRRKNSTSLTNLFLTSYQRKTISSACILNPKLGVGNSELK